jgi:hypothetical protein
MSDFDPRKVLDKLYDQMMSSEIGHDLDKAMADALIRGSGYLRFTTDNVEYVPFDSVRIDPPPEAAGEPQ